MTHEEHLIRSAQAKQDILPEFPLWVEANSAEIHGLPAHKEYNGPITFVIQHAFQGFICQKEKFLVSLSFGRTWHELCIPFSAVTGAQFNPEEAEDISFDEFMEDFDG